MIGMLSLVFGILIAFDLVAYGIYWLTVTDHQLWANALEFVAISAIVYGFVLYLIRR